MMTPRQRQLIDYIAAQMDARGYAPSQAECAAYMGCSQQAVSGMVERLRRRGVLTAERGVRVIEIAHDVPQKKLPLKPIRAAWHEAIPVIDYSGSGMLLGCSADRAGSIPKTLGSPWEN